MLQHVPVALYDTEIGAIRVGNAPTFDSLVSVELLSKSGSAYRLTPGDKQAYKADQQGFGYSAGFEVQKMLDMFPLAMTADGGVADKAWMVPLAVAQRAIADWARDPAVAVMKIDKHALSTERSIDHVVLVPLRSEAGVRLDDSMFVLRRGFDVAEGF